MLVIPTFRERPTLTPLIEVIFSALPKAIAEHTGVLIADDGSKDDTEEEACAWLEAPRPGCRPPAPSAIPELLEALTERTPMVLSTRHGDGVSLAAGHSTAPLFIAGFKHALEPLLLENPDASPPTEVAYSFGRLTSGSSKLGAKVMLRYVLQLGALYR
ncbi:glycosyltransferase family 2 protein [Athelia psychrophila]|uniref:Glycosyltransferase family 2 protein n=1 Tax=Athelia psychrophila TaxID=1759441 RepID=A0A166P9X4_9AGAM|nr:glycosyltransferase family 2 protein [Fibularhizoctonia sp. CBS 109695]